MVAESPSFSVLLIDDDIEEKRVVERVLAALTDAPVQVDYATRCSEGVGRLNRRGYDLVLLDNRLSRAISAEFSVPFIRSAFNRAPLAVITTDTSPAYLQDPEQLGVDYVVDKADLIGFLRDRLADPRLPVAEQDGEL
ncbi:MAG: hypothetical protein WBF53_15390 [Litorimonas sp.]